MFKPRFKIAIVMENIEYGGATTHLINLIKSRKFSECEFLIITNKTNKAIKQITKELDKKNIKIKFYDSFNAIVEKNFISKLFLLTFKPLLFIFSIIRMYNILKKTSYDILLANCGGYGNFRDEMASVIASRILMKKNINLLIHHCYVKPLFWNFLIKPINYFVGKYSKNLIFVSRATKRSIDSNTCLIKNSDNCAVIHNGVQLRKFKKEKLKGISAQKGVIKIGMLARIEDYKGQIDLVRSFSKLPNKLKKKFKFFFVGNGEKKQVEMLNNSINKENLNNKFKIINFINKDSLTIINNFDLLISLTKDFEGFGYSIAESLYVKTPVIATKVGGVGEYLNNKNSILIKPNNLMNISNAIKNFYFKRSKIKKKIIKGRNLIMKKFNSDLMAEKFYKVLIND